METEHVADAPVPDNVHDPPGVNATVPVGVVVPLLDMSVTVAVQEVACPITTDTGVHVTVVLVGCFPTSMVAVPELDAWFVSPA
jgi:hypothetical protein